MDTERYCPSLDDVGRVIMIRAIHEAYLQLTALNENVDCEHYNNDPAIKSLVAILRKAGHPGFTA